MKIKEELEEAIRDTITGYKEIIIGSDTPACVACLDKLQKQHVIDQKMYDQKLVDDTVRKLAWERLQKNIVMNGDTMIYKEKGEVLILCWFHVLERQILRADFIVFMDHKITCRKAEELHILNGTDTLGTWSVCNFS